ncbi:uncharacterized protein LOC101857368 [Aplysia californica]|uniref:Uncharacterized protein LOC101857368 n=1 Tax=Aplysia californica TaxID=6500 RepID=A0ABM1AA09_APLCA|nr:uncharacterized protein LOC101857368 [Aplysia californica]
MPKTSLQTSWLSVYLSLLLASTALAVIFSVIVLRLHHVPAHIPVGPALRKFVIRTRSSLLLTALEEADESKDASDGAHQKYYNFGSQDSSGISGGGFGGKRNGKIFPEERPQTAFTLADNLSQDGLTSADDDALESKRPAPPPEVVVTWQNVAETADRMLFICFTVYNVGCTAVCVSYLTFASP